MDSGSLLHEDPKDEKTPHVDQSALVTRPSAFPLKGPLFPQDLYQVLEK